MRYWTIQAGVSQKRFEKVIAKMDLYTDDELQALYNWLMEVRQGAYLTVLNIRIMVPNAVETWKNYTIFDIEGLAEQALLLPANEALRKVWQSPYRPERKIKRGKKEQPAQQETDPRDFVGVPD